MTIAPCEQVPSSCERTSQRSWAASRVCEKTLPLLLASISMEYSPGFGNGMHWRAMTSAGGACTAGMLMEIASLAHVTAGA